MDNLLCDELLQEIFQKLPPCPSTSSSVSLVSKRWLHLYRTSKTHLSLRLSSLSNSPTSSTTLQSLSSLLSHYPFLSSLSLLLPSETPTTAAAATSAFSDHLLLLISSLCPHLHGLRFLAGPVSLSSLLSLSKTCTHLTSLSINLSRPLFLTWLSNFPSLKELSICVNDGEEFVYSENEEFDSELGLESLSLSGIRAGDWGLGWLWRSCGNKVRKLQLRNCQGLGDGGSFSSFVRCLKGVHEVELRTCRTIVDGVLLRLAENCDSLLSLLVYDGGSKEGLLRFFSQCRFSLQKLDFRLPLDLNNDHLFAASLNFRTLSSLRLQSCCLVSGEGLKAIGVAMSSGLEELALINCDVVERESGLLATLGQNLKKLKKLDLSYNEMLVDKEFVSMLVSCHNLVDLNLRGCKGITSSTMVTMSRCCKRLENVDLMYCCGIESEAVELFVVNSTKLRRVQVEESKLSDAAKTWTSSKFIEVCN